MYGLVLFTIFPGLRHLFPGVETLRKSGEFALPLQAPRLGLSGIGSAWHGTIRSQDDGESKRKASCIFISPEPCFPVLW